MNLFSQIPLFSWGCFAIALLFAFGNASGLWRILVKDGSTSFIPFISLIFFILGTLGWDEPWYFWFLALLDIGTLAVLVSVSQRS